jgi:hypothetical protein
MKEEEELLRKKTREADTHRKREMDAEAEGAEELRDKT